MKTIFAFIRHGQTNWNKERRIQGLIDNPLNDEGIMQAHKIGKNLQNIDSKWDLIISSPLARATKTAQIIASYLPNIPLVINPYFIERDFGAAEGEFITAALFDKIINDDVKGLENSKHLQMRILKEVENLAKKHPDQKLLIIAHSHVIKALLTLISNKFSFRDLLDNAAIIYFVYQNGKLSLLE